MRVPAAALILLLSGCAAAGDPASPSYSAGFADGCVTASAEGTSTAAHEPQRDRARYAMDSDYRAGWISSYATCRAARRAARHVYEITVFWRISFTNVTARPKSNFLNPCAFNVAPSGCCASVQGAYTPYTTHFLRRRRFRCCWRVWLLAVMGMRPSKNSPVPIRRLPVRDGFPGSLPCYRSAKRQDRSQYSPHDRVSGAEAPPIHSRQAAALAAVKRP